MIQVYHLTEVSIGYVFRLQELWDNPSQVPKTYTEDPLLLLNYGSPVIGDKIGANSWSTTDRFSNYLNWYNDDLLLGSTSGTVIAGENDTWTGWVYLYTTNQQSTIAAVSYAPVSSIDFKPLNVNQITINNGRMCFWRASYAEQCSSTTLFRTGWNYFAYRSF